MAQARTDYTQGATEIIVYTRDQPGLFSKIAWSIAMTNASIVTARITTLTNGMALDSFWVQDTGGGAFDHPIRHKRFLILLEKSLTDEWTPENDLARLPPQRASRADIMKIPTRVIIDNTASTTHTLIEVNGRDRPGLLYRLTTLLTRLGLKISSAHISTYGERVVDVFYVKDLYGLKIERKTTCAIIRDTLMTVLDEPIMPEQG